MSWAAEELKDIDLGTSGWTNARCSWPSDWRRSPRRAFRKPAGAGGNPGRLSLASPGTSGFRHSLFREGTKNGQ